MGVQISAHMIVGEQTNFALQCLKASLECLEHNLISNVVVGVHPSCSAKVRSLIEQWADQPHRSFTDTQGDGFADWRNTVLDFDTSNPTHILKVDADETYYSHAIEELWQAALNRPESDAFMVSFYHLMRDYDVHQSESARQVVMFRVGGRWGKDVHEGWQPLNSYHHIDNCVGFVHWGYTKPQVETFLKWAKYAVLEHGNLQAYRRDGDMPYFAGWREPGTIVDDRPVKQMTEQYPDPAMKYIVGPFKTSGLTWRKWLDRIDPDVEEWYQKTIKESGGDWDKWLDALEAEWPRFGEQDD